LPREIIGATQYRDARKMPPQVRVKYSRHNPRRIKSFTLPKISVFLPHSQGCRSARRCCHTGRGACAPHPSFLTSVDYTLALLTNQVRRIFQTRYLRAAAKADLRPHPTEFHRDRPADSPSSSSTRPATFPSMFVMASLGNCDFLVLVLKLVELVVKTSAEQEAPDAFLLLGRGLCASPGSYRTSESLKTMGNDDRRPSLHEPVDRLSDLNLRFGIDARSRFIQDQHLRIVRAALVQRRAVVSVRQRAWSSFVDDYAEARPSRLSMKGIRFASRAAARMRSFGMSDPKRMLDSSVPERENVLETTAKARRRLRETSVLQCFVRPAGSHLAARHRTSTVDGDGRLPCPGVTHDRKGLSGLT
jgi:hypothetical protein